MQTKKPYIHQNSVADYLISHPGSKK